MKTGWFHPNGPYQEGMDRQPGLTVGDRPQEPSLLWVQVSAGVGPVECQWTVARVLEALTTEAQQAGVVLELLEALPGEAPGTLRSVLLSVTGEAAALLQGWTGSVQWRGRSRFRPQHRRRRFFVSVEMLVPPTVSCFDPKDLIYSMMRAGGPGGQHVNKTESAVRVTHGPSGLSAVAREERSQHLNRRLALARLAALFQGRAAAARAEAERERWAQHRELIRGAPVRIYEGPAFRRRAQR